MRVVQRIADDGRPAAHRTGSPVSGPGRAPDAEEADEVGVHG
ncbi:hypothetical protein SAMN04489712_11825 [Thermomonospora echinospora]|uniref:Uncharacterized protein n=1 Tax=Thermomonospora echinospora TaxID=1992 RepID=A0A1H6DK96_9ACTN|nr:hypothetical protein [Thermomonospora echinospora]SEG85529.1 hypothetical protein SAMN04489712_11825 [Thermomonospora echinospora]